MAKPTGATDMASYHTKRMASKRRRQEGNSALPDDVFGEAENMTEAQIKHMVDRFLGWKLPENFSPDAGISYARPNYAPSVDATPSGTNLFDAQQADAMVRYMIEGMPPR